MSEQENLHPSEVGLAVAEATPTLSKKELAKLANIIGFFRTDADAAFPVHGFEVMTDPTKDVLRERLEALKPGTLVAQRGRLESDPQFRHPIPYIIIYRQRDDGKLEFFVYQRTKLIGEDLLGQKYSVALGGHPEAPSIRFHPDWSFDTTQSLMACLVNELDEEASFNGMSFSDYSETGGMFTYAHDGFIRDDSDQVGLQHIAIVYTIGLPAGVEVECKEEELITVGFRTLDELAADLELPEVNAIYDFENWSKICITSFVDRIEAAQAQSATDALFLAEAGNEIPTEEEAQAALGRGQTSPSTFYREEDLLPESAAQFNLGVAEPISEELYALHKEHGVDLKTIELGEHEEFVQRNGSVFYSGQITHPVDGVKELNIHILVEDPAPLDTVTLVRQQLAEQWAGATEPLANGVSFSQDLGRIPDEPVDAFAKEILELGEGRGLSAGPNGDWKNPVEVDPSAETKDITELHRKIGTTDEQMKSAIDELTRISDSVQPGEEEVLTGEDGCELEQEEDGDIPDSGEDRDDERS